MHNLHDPVDAEKHLLSLTHDDGSSPKHMEIFQRSIQMFLEGSSRVSRASSSKSFDSRPQQDEKAVEFINEDHIVPLLSTTDNSLHSWKKIRPLAQVIGCISLAIRSCGTSVTQIQRDSSGETEGKPEDPEASDSLASKSEHHIDIGHLPITADQTVPLLTTVENSLHSSVTHVHHDNSDETEGLKQEVPEASDGLASTSDQPTKPRQIEKISMIVRQKNLQTLQAFGGVDGVVHALDTDLEKGISNDEYVRQQQELYLSLAPTLPFFHMIWEEIKKISAVLVFISASLSIVFEIIEKGLENGGIEAVVVLVAIILHVLVTSFHKYWKQQMAIKKLQKQAAVEQNVKEVHVIRGGESKTVCESELVCGDLVILKKGGQVPGDGLLVGDDELKLDYGSQSYDIDAEMPFLSYGGKIINRDARMIVTFTKSMMLSKATCERFKLEIHLDKLNACMHYVRLCISFLIVLVLFLRYKAGKIDDDDVYRPESMTETSGIRRFSNTFEKIIKEQMYRFKALTMILGVSMVGLTEGVPFVVSLAIVYWNHKTLSGKATEQGLHGMLKMASVENICTDVFGEFTEDDTEVQKLFIGGELISEGRTLSPNVVEAICEGIGTSKDNVYLHGVKYKLGLNRERMQEIQHLNGQVKEIMSKCTHYYNIQGEKVTMNDAVRRNFGQVNDHDTETIAIACKLTNSQTQDAEDWILVGLLGLKNIDKEATKKQVKACRECGIKIILVSGKKLPILQNIALQYGLTANDDPTKSLVLTAEDLRKYTDVERNENADKICVLGEAWSSDKSLLVETLREKGEVVVLLGQRTDEASALIGVDIWDGSLSELINMVGAGKNISNNIHCFLQPVLITTISGNLINFIQIAVWGDASLTTVQSVYVNLAVVFLGGLALLTKESADKPISCGSSLVTSHMIINILMQVSYQLTCLVIIQTKGSKVIGSSQNMKAMLSNLFIICQFFNLFNARELQKKNFLRCIHRHITFWFAITGFMVLHATFVVVQDIIGDGPKLNWKLWAGCVLFGLFSWLFDWIAKCISSFII